MTTITISMIVCFAALTWLVQMLRSDRVSLGLPVAYLSGLLLIHVPGAYAHLYDDWFLTDPLYTQIGIRFTAIASTCFVMGVWLARAYIPSAPIRRCEERQEFWLFCLVGGWLFTFGLSPLHDVPSLGAAVDEGGAVWMLGVLLAFRYALQERDYSRLLIWFVALSVFPVLTLVQRGFLSYGAAAVIVVCSVFTICARRVWRVAASIALIIFFGMTLFVNYFENRNVIRSAVWYDAALEQRVGVVMNMFNNFKWFDPTDVAILIGLDQRLNQNYFVGLAAHRIDTREIDYLYGRSVEDAFLSLIPRAVWPGKTVVAGSPKIVSDMTGLELDPSTSWGVGNVMELQINFGLPGVIFGFLGLGWLLGFLDRKAAAAEARGDLSKVFLYFLPAVALIQPNGSMVELAGGSAAALVAAFGWRWTWNQWSERRAREDKVPAPDGRA